MSEELRRCFAVNLRRYLEDNDYTQADLARAMQVSTGTVSEWCTGVKMPRIDKIEDICQWLGIDLHDLIPSSKTSTMKISGMMVTDHDEQEVVIGYRNADNLEKAMVRRTLGIDKKGSGGQEAV